MPTVVGRTRAVWGLAGLGLAGTLLVALAAPRALSDPAVGWWYGTPWGGGRGLGVAVVYSGMVVLALAWLGLGWLLAGRRWREAEPLPAVLRAPTPGQLRWIALAWIVPLALAPPLFSRDLYSYLAQGTILRLGLDPYHATPAVLAFHGQARVLSAVSPFWRHTPAPYGPLFLGLLAAVTDLTGSHLAAGVLAARGVDLLGAVLLAIYLPRLARTLGGDPARALWLGLLSPLVTLGLVAAGHNDLLMAGLLAAGVTVASKGRPVTGVALCALAATVKVPALAGVLFVSVAWARAEVDRRRRVRFAISAGVSALTVLVLVSLVTGTGAAWLTSGVFSTPAKVRLAITPATAVGYTVATLLHGAGVAIGSRGIEGAFGAAVAVVCALVALVLLVRGGRVRRLAVSLGLVLLIAAAGGPAAWPWYFAWGLVLVAGAPGWQRSRALAAGLVVGGFLVKPSGILALPLGSAPAVIALYLLLGLAAAWQRRRHRPLTERWRPMERDVGAALP